MSDKTDNNVMLDRDLAELYSVETKYLKPKVRRNKLRFPNDFMFELTIEEFKNCVYVIHLLHLPKLELLNYLAY